jgi:hypothetical protein
MMGNKTTKQIFINGIFLFFITFSSVAQMDSAALAAADTTGFSVNHADGWELYNSYAAPYKTDSVQLELVIQHTNNISWSQEQYIGKVKTGSLLPQNSQSLWFNLTVSAYVLRIGPDGKCYLRFVSGTSPNSNPVVIPVKVYYKK